MKFLQKKFEKMIGSIVYKIILTCYNLRSFDDKLSFEEYQAMILKELKGGENGE